MYVCTGYLVGCFFLVRTPRHLVHHLTLPSPTFVQTSEIDIGQTKEGGQKRGGGAPSPLFVFDYPKGRCTAVCTFLHVPTGVDNPSARNVHILYDGYPCGVSKRHVKNLLYDRPAFVSEAGSVSPRHYCASSCTLVQAKCLLWRTDRPSGMDIESIPSLLPPLCRPPPRDRISPSSAFSLLLPFGETSIVHHFR